MKRMAVVLQGGGATGAYEVGVLKRLSHEPDWPPNLVSGFSIGAMNAAVLTGPRGEDRIAALEDTWDRLSSDCVGLVPGEYVSMFGNRNFFLPRIDYFNMHFWNSLYDMSPFKIFLQEVIDFEKINMRSSEANRLLLNATNIRTGEITSFDNHRQEIAPDHIMASGSLPLFFPPRRIGEEYYWDGGLFTSTPLSSLFDHFPKDQHYGGRVFIVKVFPRQRNTVPTNLREVAERVLEILSSTKIASDLKGANRIHESTYQTDSETTYKLIKNTILIEPVDSMVEEDNPVCQIANFSRRTTRKRIEAGFQLADRILAK